MRLPWVVLRAVAIACASVLAWCATAQTPNYQGLWWNSPPESESGWGVNLAHQGDTIFATWFTYDAAGRAWWLSMAATRSAPGVYSGTLVETTGPPFHASPFDPLRVTRTSVGEGTLTFVAPDTGTLRYVVKGAAQTKYITRQAFGALPSCAYGTRPDFASATNYQDLWWAAGGTESGWGLNLTHQGGLIFATWFTYGDDGKPAWLSGTLQGAGDRRFAGALIRTTGPPFDAVPFDRRAVSRAVVGRAEVAFADGASGTFSYSVDGHTGSKAIVRQLFAPPAGTVCGDPVRALSSFDVAAAGDIGECFGRPAALSGAAKTAALVSPSDALVLTAGDNVYDYGTPEEFANCFDPTWGAFKDRIRPTIGNHDTYTAGAAGYFGYFGARAGPDLRGWYSFDHGGWHFVSLNAIADAGPESEQYRWLESDLAGAKDHLCTVALLHYPAFNSGAVYGSVPAMRPVFDLLQRSGVDVLLSGHEHLYERFAPQRADGSADPAQGLRQFVIGTGGHALNPFGAPLPNSEFRNNVTWGILRLTLGQGAFAWKMMPVGGGPAIDAGTAVCRP